MAKYSDFGALMEKRDGGYYIKINKDLNIKINGQDMAGKYISVAKPTVKFERMLANGVITEEEYNEKVARFEDDGDLSFIRQELTVVQD